MNEDKTKNIIEFIKRHYVVQQEYKDKLCLETAIILYYQHEKEKMDRFDCILIDDTITSKQISNIIMPLLNYDGQLFQMIGDKIINIKDE